MGRSLSAHHGSLRRVGRSIVQLRQGEENKGPPKFKQMQIPTRDNFAVWSVDHKLITLSRNQRGALVRALAMNDREGAEEDQALDVVDDLAQRRRRNRQDRFNRDGANDTAKR
jgi:hypothetical protein